MNTDKPWGVMDRAGFGWGRYASREEADARKADLERMRHSEHHPDDLTAQFDVLRVVGDQR